MSGAQERRNKKHQDFLWAWIQEEQWGMCWCGSEYAAEKRLVPNKGVFIGCRVCTPSEDERVQAVLRRWREKE